MADDPKELMIPMMRDMRADMAKMADSMATMSVEMRAMLKHMGGMMDLQDIDREDIARIKVRLDRIETRLELVDTSEG